MGRVEEALRRAAEQGQSVGQSQAPVPDPLDADDVERLSQEPYPIEMPERNWSRGRGTGSRSSADGAPHGRPQENSFHVAESVLKDRIDKRLSEKVVIDGDILPASREQYRRLAAVLHDAQLATGLRVLMIGSAVAGEGKTLTAANLALTLSESYLKRVLLIDADLRKPSLHTVFRVDASTGLTDGLTAPEAGKFTVRRISEHLSLLPAGRPLSDPMAGLTSQRMRRLVDEAKETFDWVIIDTPPLVLLPDANLLGSLVEGTVLVIRAESTPHHLIKRAVDAIGRERIFGAVLNSASTSPLGHYSYYSYDYGTPSSATQPT